MAAEKRGRLDFPPFGRPSDIFYRAYTLLENRTPIHADCGELCGGACCKGSDADGMLLFPGEEAFLQKVFAACPEKPAGFTFTGPAERRLLTCAGKCDRVFRPLSCRIFPLFPALGADGRIRVMLDVRALRVCPMAKTAARLDRDFIRAVRRTGRLLACLPACRDFLRRQTEELEELARLAPLDKGLLPIRYR